jgi:hypothetical protein
LGSELGNKLSPELNKRYEMNALEAHIKAENAKHANSFLQIVEDPEHWASYGVHTVEQFEHYQARALVWDLYKDAFGIRPRHMDLDSMTVEQLEAEAESLYEMVRTQIQAEKDLAKEHARAEEAHEQAMAEALIDRPLTQSLDVFLPV